MPLVVIDADAGRLALAESQGYTIVMGDAAEEQTLRRAHIDTARVVAVVLPDDAVNVFVTLSARELSGSVEIIARGERPDTERKLLRSGATRVVLPAAAGANRIARMITHPSAETLLGDADSMGQLNDQLLEIGMEIGQITIEADSELRGATLADVDLRQSAIVTSEQSKGVDFSFEPGQLVLAGRSAESGESRVELPIDHAGASVRIKLDPRFMADFLKVLDPSETVTVEITDAQSACVCGTEDGYGYVIMPLAAD